MRWYEDNPHKGEKRTVRRFLILPHTLGGVTRWLEFAWITKEWTYEGGGDWGWKWIKWGDLNEGRLD